MFKGQIFSWKGNRLTNPIPAHNGPVTTICQRKATNQKGVITGGKDGTIIIWDQNLKQLQKYDLKDLRLYLTKVIAVAENDKGCVALGTRSSEIAEILP